MDTGIISILIRKLPYNFTGRNVIADLFLFLNIVLWTSFFLITVIQYIRRPSDIKRYCLSMTDDLLCLPAISISLTTIYEMIALATTSWGRNWQVFCYVLWWIDTFLSFCFGLLILHVTIESSSTRIKSFEPTVLLCGISAITSATGAGSLAMQANLTAAEKVPMIIVAYILLGFGSILASMLTILIFVRYYTSGLGPELKMPSVFVLIGPWGQSSFAFQALGQAVITLFPMHASGILYQTQTAIAIGSASLLAGIFLYGIGFFFFLFAISITVHSLWTYRASRRPLPWSLAWWSFIFPVGVWTSATEQLATVASSGPLKVWACVLVMSLVLLWLMNTVVMSRHLLMRAMQTATKETLNA